MKAAISAIHTEVDHLKESIKMVEFLMCTRDYVKNTNDEILGKLIPPKSDSANAANDNLCTLSIIYSRLWPKEEVHGCQARGRH